MRIHIIHEELRGSLPENSRTVGPQVKDGATAPARQRHIAMRRVGFGLFHNISVKTMFFNNWWFSLNLSKI